ncbi:MAG: ArsR family transcriptional regulator [Deltaproteobacteria bacterium]|jgi:repressor of nif and glnA expression|nr:ArsR family transcriptional regulator [Deltaproteobacteria bacterium]
MGTNFARLLSEDRRLVILRLLEKAPGSEANHYILREALEERGHKVGCDVVRSELAWLEEQGLVSLEILESLAVAALTGRGLDVGRGRSRCPGVKMPAPGE